VPHRARRQSRHEEAARRRGTGATVTLIFAELGADRKTVQGWLRFGSAPLWQQPSSDQVLELGIGDLAEPHGSR
jgi:hypothetical protein